MGVVVRGHGLFLLFGEGMAKNILLIEPKYTYVSGYSVSLSFRKIATYHTMKGDNVYYTSRPPTRKILLRYPQRRVDLIYITAIFTYDLPSIFDLVKTLKHLFPDSRIKIGGIAATLLPDVVERETGIKPHIGLWDKVENLLPNYDLFPPTKYAIAFTTRGCVRKCQFCAVRSLEPKFMVAKNWKKQFKSAAMNGHRVLHLQDNNFLAAPFSHQKNVIRYLVKKFKNRFLVDFNQGLDCRLWKRKHHDNLKQIRMENIRFAFDGMQEDGYFQRTVTDIIKRHPKSPYFRYLMLYNFTDKPEELWYRLHEAYKLQKKFPKSEHHAYLMRYQPLDALVKNSYIGEHWNEKTLIAVRKLVNAISFRGALVFRDAYENGNRPGYIFSTLDFIGRSADEFVDNLNKTLIWTGSKYKFVKHKKITDY